MYFLSSTAKDLAEHRSAAHARLARSGQFHCIRQEDFGPQSATAIEVCRKKVLAADVFVGLIGQRRGWEPDGDPSQRSITEMEYDWAKDAGRRRYVWILPDNFPLPANMRDTDAEHARQQAFRTRLTADGALVVSQTGFGSPELLAADITQHLFTVELLEALDERGDTAKAASGGLDRDTIIKLARRIKPDEALDFDRAMAELDNAVNIALDVIAKGERRSKEDDFVKDVLARVAERTKAGEFDRAVQEVDAGLAELDQREKEQRDNMQRSRIALLEASSRTSCAATRPQSRGASVISPRAKNLTTERCASRRPGDGGVPSMSKVATKASISRWTSPSRLLGSCSMTPPTPANGAPSLPILASRSNVSESAKTAPHRSRKLSQLFAKLLKIVQTKGNSISGLQSRTTSVSRSQLWANGNAVVRGSKKRSPFFEKRSGSAPVN
jgi:hypothetical protein